MLSLWRFVVDWVCERRSPEAQRGVREGGFDELTTYSLLSFYSIQVVYNSSFYRLQLPYARYNSHTTFLSLDILRIRLVLRNNSIPFIPFYLLP